MTTITTEAKLYVGTYAKYNNGSIEGAYLSISDYSDAIEFLQACAELHSDEEDPEFMFQDFEGFPDSLYGESMSESEIQAIFDYTDVMSELENADWFDLYNQYCDNSERYDDRIYQFDDEFFEMAFSGEPMKAARAASFGELNWSDDYIKFNGYGNLESISDIENEIDKEEVIQHILENREMYSF